ncbi:hypothetical protein HMPREF9574_00749 [Cutibacterium acnes HL074PA1]|nr:hypothetical protein HMPREF9574_00749 [Cutibacterium acnes HL074PA1]EFS55211.1 hypothetical protein HMPREF9593_02265 [Cutibacterium acnes HL046PA2]
MGVPGVCGGNNAVERHHCHHARRPATVFSSWSKMLATARQ